MRDRDILDHIKNSIDEAPIDLLDSIKSQPVAKMIKHDDITRQEKRISFKPMMSWVSVAAVFALVFLNLQLFRLPDSQIYLDVNPGIQITTNSRDKVIRLEPINEDAVIIIKDIDFKNKELDKVTEDILDSLIDKDFIDEVDGVMLLSVYNKDAEKSQRQVSELDNVIHNKLDDINMNPILLTQSLDKSNTVDEFAREYGISVGKMTFIRNMIILNPDLKTEDLVGLSLTELIEISRQTGIDIGRILNTEDDTRIKNTGNSPPPLEADDMDSRAGHENVQPTGKQIIGEARAKEIALSLVQGQIVKFELDYDDDEPEYEVEIIANGYEYEIEIDGYTGKVLKFDKDELDDD